MTDPPLPVVPGLAALEILARGERGVLYRARQPALDREVAVRVLADPPGAAPPAHPHLAGVYGTGRTAAGEPYVLLPYLPGGSLADRLARGTLPAAEVADMGAKLAGALAALHAAGLVHGRVTPANVLWSAFGSPVLTDARLVPAAEPAADVHALAGVLRAALGPDGDPAVAAALAPALAADPRQRPSAADLAARLRAARPRPPGGPAQAGRRILPRVWLLLGVAAAVAVGAAAVGSARGGGVSAADVDALVDTRAKSCATPTDPPQAAGVAVAEPAPGATVPADVPVAGTADPSGGPVHLFAYVPGICLYYFEPEWRAEVAPDGRWAAEIRTGLDAGDAAALWAVQLSARGRTELRAVAERFERRIDGEPYVAVLPEGARGTRVAVTIG